ncbi:MAG: 50S ribosomal protein L10 [Puniceicoccales bacterium]|jgi:large subunit ribosomal protein L10|nr:50S ribosomal protein L10 [Puniceicoccales bacterium]
MRKEKKILAEEVSRYIRKSDYFYLVGFDRLSVDNVAALRSELFPNHAEYHVVKNAMLKMSVEEIGLPAMDASTFVGPTAIISGGDDALAVAKALVTFFESSENGGKITLKGGFFTGRLVNSADILTLSKLPSLDVLRTTLLSLMQTTMRQMLLVCNASMQSFVRLLGAFAEKNK